MPSPTVVCLMLTANRQALADRAVRCYLAQTYEPRSLFILDSGKTAYELPEIRPNPNARITVVRGEFSPKLNIGQLRNYAMTILRQGDIVCNWDDDDWSAPERIAEQVKLLQESGCDAVGYREMLFWDSRNNHENRVVEGRGAWLYRNTDPRYIISTSLCYWRKTWGRVPFADTPIREWRPWFDGRLNTLGVAATEPVSIYSSRTNMDEPRMIAEIHGGNTCAHTALDPKGVNRDGSLAWQRVPEWDQRVRQILEAA